MSVTFAWMLGAAAFAKLKGGGGEWGDVLRVRGLPSRRRRRLQRRTYLILGNPVSYLIVARRDLLEIMTGPSS